MSDTTKNPVPSIADARKYHFPPFPEVPDGVTILPFKDFKECGIQVFTGEDDTEKDGLGIPTIPLRVKHDTDVSKTNPNRAKRTPREMAASRPRWRKEWWEDWEEGEDLRIHGPYNVNDATIDRFHHAASDFQKYRKFPPFATQVQYLWDQFRIFAGLLGTTPVWNMASNKPSDDADAQVSDDDFDDEPKGKFVNQGGPGEKRHPPRLRPRAPYELYGTTPTVVQDNDDIKALLDAARERKEDRLIEFLQDPGRGVQVFLSSYMKNQGLVWADRNLINAPHLLRFFVRFLLRNHVLPDKSAERSLRRALEVIDVAAKELPLTAKVSKLLPDDFSVACQEQWGHKVEAYSGARGDADDKGGDGDDAAVFESTLKGENIELLKMEDLLDNSSANDNANSDDPASTSDADSDAAAAAEWRALGASQVTDWVPPARPSLATLLPPSAAPLTQTHTPGIVECSVRRVSAILPPPAAANPAPAPAPSDAGVGEADADALAVEHALEALMWRAVLAPWPAWDGTSTAAPRVLRTSKGMLSPPAAPAETAEAESTGAEESRGPAGLELHSPFHSPITLLLDPAAAQTLCVGMGLGGTWVQLARVEDLPPAQPAPEKDAPAPAKERQGSRYWYADELVDVIPSFWIV